MILAGDIGGTNARLAYFQPQNGHLRLVSERIFPSREHSELGEIVTRFLDDSGTRPEAACFGIAGPVRNGRVETSNLPWVVEQSRLAKQIHLPSTLLINDLEASAWGIGALADEDLVSLNRVTGPAVGNQAVIAPGTGLGEAGLFWDGSHHHVFACEGGHADFGPQGDLQIELAALPASALWTRELRAYSLGAGSGECLRIPPPERLREGIRRVCGRTSQRRSSRNHFKSSDARERSLSQKKRWTCGLRSMALKRETWR